jgi:hypothetical protein
MYVNIGRKRAKMKEPYAKARGSHLPKQISRRSALAGPAACSANAVTPPGKLHHRCGWDQGFARWRRRRLSPFVTAIQELHQREKRSSGERSLGIVSNETAERVLLANDNPSVGRVRALQVADKLCFVVPQMIENTSGFGVCVRTHQSRRGRLRDTFSRPYTGLDFARIP